MDTSSSEKNLDVAGVVPLRSCVVGGLLWVLFAFVAVAIREVRWEESYEFAQVLLGLIPYPEGHPIYQHVHNMFCLQTYLTAAVMWFDPNPLIACGYRNVLYVLAKTVPFFLLGTFLSRRIVWGHLSALLALLTTELFTNAYPSIMWPTMSSNGVIGLAAALTALFFLAADRPRAAYLIVGAMPAIHIGQFPPVFAISCLYFVDSVRRRRPYFLRDAASGLAAGLTVTVLSGAIFLLTRVPPPTSGPYFADIPWKEVWRGFIVSSNFHRELKFGEDQIALVWMVLLGSAAAVIEFKDGKRGPWFWICAYGWIVSLTVWSIMGVHYLLGDRIPPVLINWMPYRLSNHLVPLLVPMMVALVTGVEAARYWKLLLAALLLSAGFGVEPNHVYLALCGIATFAVCVRLHPYRGVAVFWILVVAAGCLGLWKAFGPYAHWWIGGGLLAFVTYCLEGSTPSVEGILKRWPAFVATACIVSAVVILAGQWPHRKDVVERLSLTPFEEQVRSYLAAHGEPNAMIIMPPLWSMQERLGHPVITEAATLSWIPYRKSLGPSLWKLYREIYEMDLATLEDKDSWLQRYQAVWSNRTKSEWKTIGMEYGSSYVIASTLITLQLPLAVDGDLLRMYVITGVTIDR